MNNDLAQSVSKGSHMRVWMRHSRKRKVIVATAFLGTFIAPNQSVAQTAATLLDNMMQCRKIVVPMDRLSCMDQIADALTALRTAGKLESDLRPAVERPQTLGLTDPVRPAQATKTSVRPVVKELTAVIVAATPTSGGRWRLQLDNGQVWRTLADLKVEPRKKASIRIAITVTGGFRASIARGAPVYVERLR